MQTPTLKIALIATFLLSGCASEVSDAPEVELSTEIPATRYDAELAQSLGADDYGMRSYVFATLKTGPEDQNITDEARRKELFAGHFANMGRLAEEGKLVLAGPFIEAAPKRGLFILNVATIEEAEALVQTDPAISAGIFVVEFDKYYGSAALVQIQDVHKRLQKTKIE